MSESVNAPDLSGILGNLLANPEALSGMMNLIGNLRTKPPEEKEVASEQTNVNEEKAQDKEPAAIPAIADVASNLNLAALAPLFSGGGALAPLKASNKGEKDGFEFDSMKRRRCLLEAIRPYLSPARCEHLNLLLRILDILSLLSQKK